MAPPVSNPVPFLSVYMVFDLLHTCLYEFKFFISRSISLKYLPSWYTHGIFRCPDLSSALARMFRRY